jgi:hypothetical protein
VVDFEVFSDIRTTSAHTEETVSRNLKEIQFITYFSIKDIVDFINMSAYKV